MDNEDDQECDDIAGLTLGTLDFEGSSLDLKRYLSRTYDDIELASTELPPIIEWVNIQLQDATERRYVRKHRVSEVEAEVYFELVKSDFLATFGTKPTATAIGHAMALDPRVIDAHAKLATAEGWVSRLRTLQDSLAAKLDLVRSTESTRRRVNNLNQQ